MNSKPEHDWSRWPGGGAIGYQWCSRCGLFSVVALQQTAYFVLGKPLPTGHLTMDSGLHVDPGCGSGTIYLVEMRQHRPTRSDPLNYDCVVVWASRSKLEAIRWLKLNGPKLEDHSKQNWWWLAVYAQGLDHDTEDLDLSFYNWNGQKLDCQPVAAYRVVSKRAAKKKAS